MPRPTLTQFQFNFIKKYQNLGEDKLKKRFKISHSVIISVRRAATYADYLDLRSQKIAERKAISLKLTGKKRIRFASIDTRAMPGGIDPKVVLKKDLEDLENMTSEVSEENIVSLAEVLKEMRDIKATMARLLEAWNK